MEINLFWDELSILEPWLLTKWVIEEETEQKITFTGLMSSSCVCDDDHLISLVPLTGQ